MPEPEFPLTVAFLGDPYRHRARWEPGGDTVRTACGKQGPHSSNGWNRPGCPNCAAPTEEPSCA
ncbi:hypothetical protein RM780_04145 [Streptomyces sp. DSM 44917]|uniref:Zinc-ribbon domain-containing protein n=1 Tax=Streptomyces boetiae TaxID=3075541 RepID=A0ABU2L3M1_9ACTN|nr:hypothetical protein [Streptomyces sp. DSM 44917]MDT0306153.1 hypothetical protein [Streptomyces sp. DSM 44917]